MNLGGKRLTVSVLEYSGMFDESNVSIAAGQTPEWMKSVFFILF